MNQFPLHVMTTEEIQMHLMCHHKYFANPLTPQEKALIIDIVNVCRPMTNKDPLKTWKEAWK